MQYTKIRGFDISKLTLGTVQLGMEYGIANKSGKPNMGRSFEVLKAAVEGGLNSFDTAELYGDSEVVLGNFFSSNIYGIKQPLITTKFKITAIDKMDATEIEGQIYEHIEKSLQRLKIRKIPIYMLHNAKDMTAYGNTVSDILKKLKAEGLIEKAGVSVYTPEDVDEMLKNDVYEAIQIPMNIMDYRFVRNGLIKKLQEENIIVFVRSVFLQGLFFIKPEELTGNLKVLEKHLRQLNMLAEQAGLSIAQLALSFIRDIEGITSLVIGAETPEQVKENIILMDTPPITEKTRYEICRLFEDVPEELLNPGLWNRK